VIGRAGKQNDKTENAVLDELRSMRSELADLRMQVATLQGSDSDSVRTRLTQSP
jgi:hypothetical protein